MGKPQPPSNFNDFLALQMNSFFDKSFPGLSKLLPKVGKDVDDKKDSDKSEKKVEEEEEGTPNKKRPRTTNAMLAGSLDELTEQVRNTNIIMDLSYKEHVQATRLLTRLVEGGAATLGAGGAGGAPIPGPAPSVAGGVASLAAGVLGGAAEVAGGAAIVSSLPAIITGVAAVAAAAAVGYGAFKVGGYLADKFNPPEPGSPKAKEADTAAEISKLDNDIATRREHLKNLDKLEANSPTERDKKKYEEERKQDNDKIQEYESKKTSLEVDQEKELKEEAKAEAIVDGTAKAVPVGISVSPAMSNVATAARGINLNGSSPFQMMSGTGGVGTPVGAPDGAGFPHGSTGLGSGHGGGKSANPKNESIGMNYFKSQGYTDEQAAVIMGNLQQESSFNPDSINYNDAGQGNNSEGIAQWNRKRLSDMHEFVEKETGKSYNQLSADEKYKGQLHFVNHELHSRDYANAMAALKAGRYGDFSHNYEGYGDNSTDTRLGNARRILGVDHSGGHIDTDAGPTSADGVDVRNAIGDVSGLSKEQIADRVARVRPTMGKGWCVELVQKFWPDAGGVKTWRRGDPAQNAPNGSGLAMFQSSSGVQSEKYDDGGIGTPKRETLNHMGTSHAIVKEYNLPGGGFKAWEQWPGSPAHEADFTPGNRDREHDSNQYYTIKGPDGRQRATPLNREQPRVAQAQPSPYTPERLPLPPGQEPPATPSESHVDENGRAIPYSGTDHRLDNTSYPLMPKPKEKSSHPVSVSIERQEYELSARKAELQKKLLAEYGLEDANGENLIDRPRPVPASHDPTSAALIKASATEEKKHRDAVLHSEKLVKGHDVHHFVNNGHHSVDKSDHAKKSKKDKDWVGCDVSPSADRLSQLFTNDINSRKWGRS